MTPSRLRTDTVGLGDFHAVGEALARMLIDVAKLRPDERILDIGCGIGRVAVPLTRYLEGGEYVGFDVTRTAIDWCRREITSRHPNFSFDRVDVYSKHYNPKGTIPPTKFTFPCANGSIDVAFLSSILTHMTPDAAAHYVSETARVLKSGGRAVMTFFLLDDVVRANARSFDPVFVAYPEPWWAVKDPNDPEAAVAFDIQVVERALAERSLEVTRISRGAWSVHADPLTYQDVVVARKI